MTDDNAKPTTRKPAGGVQVHPDAAGVRTQGADKLDTHKEVPVWHPDHESEPPAGSTAESLLDYERGVPLRVTPPTHHHWLGDGRIVTGYSGGTHYTEVDDDGNDVVSPIFQRFAG